MFFHLGEETNCLNMLFLTKSLVAEGRRPKPFTAFCEGAGDVKSLFLVHQNTAVGLVNECLQAFVHMGAENSATAHSAT